MATDRKQLFATLRLAQEHLAAAKEDYSQTASQYKTIAEQIRQHQARAQRYKNEIDNYRPSAGYRWQNDARDRALQARLDGATSKLEREQSEIADLKERQAVLEKRLKVERESIVQLQEAVNRAKRKSGRKG